MNKKTKSKTITVIASIGMFFFTLMSLEIPVGFAALPSIIIANGFVGYNALSYLAINQITSNFITSTSYAGLLATSPITFTNGNTIGCPTCASNAYSATNGISLTGIVFSLIPLTAGTGITITNTNNIALSGLFTTLTGLTVTANIVAHNSIVTQNITSHSLQLNNSGNNNGILQYIGSANSNVVISLPGIAGTLASLAGQQTFTASKAFISTPNAVIVAKGNVLVNQINFNRTNIGSLQWLTKNTYTNTNSTMWIVYAESQSASATLQMCMKYGTLTTLVCNNANTVFNVAVPATVITEEMETIIVPEGMTMNMVYTGTWTFNNILT